MPPPRMAEQHLDGGVVGMIERRAPAPRRGSGPAAPACSIDLASAPAGALGGRHAGSVGSAGSRRAGIPPKSRRASATTSGARHLAAHREHHPLGPVEGAVAGHDRGVVDARERLARAEAWAARRGGRRRAPRRSSSKARDDAIVAPALHAAQEPVALAIDLLRRQLGLQRQLGGDAPAARARSGRARRPRISE